MIVWESVSELRLSDESASVERFDPKIRKSVALVWHKPTHAEVVAYFRNEEIAKEFCDRFLGGVRYAEGQT